MKLLVITFYAKELPSVLLEAMACGTIVISTPVGAISDYLINDENGFIYNDNSSITIPKTIMSALNYENLGDIVKNARDYIIHNFTFYKTSNKWAEILNSF